MNRLQMSDGGVSIVVPTFARPELLRRCIAGLSPSIRDTDEIIVVLRPMDRPSWDVVDGLRADALSQHLRTVDVTQPGVWPAIVAGVEAAEREFVGFLDDDAIPMPGWPEAIARRFRDRSVGAVGGRILNFADVRTENSFFTGGHVAHIDRRGIPRTQLHGCPAGHMVEDVDFLAGSNMAFRRRLLGGLADINLPAMAPGMELVLAARVKAYGLRVVFDSDIQVEHHPGPRAEVSRDDRNSYAYSYAYTMTIAMRSRPYASRVYFKLVGSRVAPGLLTAPVCGVKGRRGVACWTAAQRGRRAAEIARGGRDGIRPVLARSG